MRIETRALLDLLTDLLATVDPKVSGTSAAVVELHTCRGAWLSDPGDVDLLAGASTTGHAAGHTYTPCDGQLPGGAVLLAHHDAKAIVGVFREAAKQTDPVHAVDVRRDGPMLHVREDPNLIDDGLSLSLALAEADRFPWSVYRLLDREQLVVETAGTGAMAAALAVVPRTDLTRAVLEPFVKVAKRRGDYLRVYRTHQDQHILVQIGDTYRGVLLPVKRNPDKPQEGDPQRPDADVHAPDLPPEVPEQRDESVPEPGLFEQADDELVTT